MENDLPTPAASSEAKPKLSLSPLATLIITGFVGLLSAGVGASVQGYWSAKLERQKFEAALIQDALTPPAIADRKAKLQFLIDIGLITSLDPEKLREVIATNNLPAATPASSGALPPNTLACALTAAGFLTGGAVSNAEQLKDAVMRFQTANHIPSDGLVGAQTALAMQQAAPACFK